MHNFIRGSQVTFHRFRMLMQVSRVMLRISLALILLSFAYVYLTNIEDHEWSAGLAWIKKDVYSGSLRDRTTLVYTPYGDERHIPLANVAYDPYILEIVDHFDLVFKKALSLTLIVLSLSIGAMVLYFLIHGRTIKSSKNLRGMFTKSESILKRSIKHHNRAFSYKPFQLAGFSYPITGSPHSFTAGEQSHTMLIGSTGSGKTTIIMDLIYQLHQRNQKAIIIDIKGDYIQHFYREKRGDIILNPLDQRGRNWSIFKETNALKGFSTIAKSLLPKESKGDPIWTDAARAVLAEMATLYMNEGLSMSAFADKLLKSDLKTLTKLLEKTSASKVINEDIEKAALSVMMVLSTYMRPLKLYNKADDPFSITDWVHDEKQQCFLFISSKADVKEDLNPLISTQVDIAINALRSLGTSSNTPKLWFILDELPYFEQPLPSLQSGLATARSFGGCFLLGIQDIAALSKIYSRESAESIANSCKTKIFMNCAGKETAEWASASLGSGEVEEWQEGLSYGSHEMRDGIQVHRQKTLKKVVLPSELMKLSSGEGYMSFAGFLPSLFKFNSSHFKTISTAFIENKELVETLQKALDEAEKRRKEIESKATKKPSNQELEMVEEKPEKRKAMEMEEEGWW